MQGMPRGLRFVEEGGVCVGRRGCPGVCALWRGGVGCFGVHGMPRRLCCVEGHMECFALHCGAADGLGAVLYGGVYVLLWLAGDAVGVVLP